MQKENAKSPRFKKYNHHTYDDATIENMMRYYKLDSYDSLMKYIKNRGLQPEDPF